MAPEVERLEIPLERGRLAARLHHPPGQARAAAVVAHGQYSSMASRKLTALSQAMARAGCYALQFDHSGCGDSLGELELTTLTGRLEEFLAAVDVLERRAPGLPLVYMGSSLGGLTALLAADRRPPACTACWSAPTDLAEIIDRLDAPPEGFAALINDLPNHDPAAALSRARNILFVHGENDQVAPASQARRGHELARPPKDLLVIPGADHALTNPRDQRLAVERTLAWIDSCLAA